MTVSLIDKGQDCQGRWTHEVLGIRPPFPCRHIPASSALGPRRGSPGWRSWAAGRVHPQLQHQMVYNFLGVPSLTGHGKKHRDQGWGWAVMQFVPLRLATYPLCFSCPVCVQLGVVRRGPPPKKTLLGSLTLFPLQVLILGRGNGPHWLKEGGGMGVHGLEKGTYRYQRTSDCPVTYRPITAWFGILETSCPLHFCLWFRRKERQAWSRKEAEPVQEDAWLSPAQHLCGPWCFLYFPCRLNAVSSQHSHAAS